MGNLRVLFLGASPAVGLLGRFRSAANELGTGLEMLSCEEEAPWHPIALAGLARPVPAPPFADPGFAPFLKDVVRGHRIDIVIPGEDEAAIALARVRADLTDVGTLAVCSSLEVCETMTDKRQADLLFRSLGLRTPSGRRFPMLAKPRRGSGSRGIAVLEDDEDLTAWQSRNRLHDYLLQPFIAGREFSLDGYVDAAGRTLGLVSRVRVAVKGGEVSITLTERNEAAIAMGEELLRWGTWYGPLTIQVVDDGRHVHLLECNPRFGSGVTCSIEAGLAFPEWILRERLGLPLPAAPVVWRSGLCMSRSWNDHFCVTGATA